MMSDRSFAVLIAFSLAPALSADQVTLKNGDRVTGAIVKKDGETLTIKTDHFGTVTVDWDKVASVRAESPVTVQMSGGEVLKGEISPEQDGRLQIDAGDTVREVTMDEVVALRNAAEQQTFERLLAPGWMRLWTGTVTLGFAGTQGNAETRTLTAGLNAARATRADKTTVYLNAIRAAAMINEVQAATAQALRAGWGYDRNAGSGFFVNTFNDYELDRFQNLDLRFVLGGGVGYRLWKGERGRLDVLGGGAYNHESFAANGEAAAFSRSSGEAYAGDEFTFKMNSVTSLFQKARVFPNISQTGEYRMNFDAGATTQLTKWLTWNLAVSNRLLSNPVGGRERNDFLYTTGIGVNFAR